MLIPARDENGSTLVESVAAMLLLLILVFGVIEIAYLLYARNVVRASAHEGARAALELGRTPQEASFVAESSVRRAVGGLVRDIDVLTATRSSDGSTFVSVSVRADVRGFGPIPIPAKVDAVARVSRAHL